MEMEPVFQETGPAPHPYQSGSPSVWGLGRRGPGLGLVRPRLGLLGPRLGFGHAGVRLAGALQVGLLGPLAQDGLVLSGRDPLALEAHVAPRAIALVLAHPASVDLRVAERLVRAGVVGRRAQRAVVRLARLRAEARARGPVAQSEPALHIRGGDVCGALLEFLERRPPFLDAQHARLGDRDATGADVHFDHARACG